MIFLIIYCIISAVIIGWAIIPETEFVALEICLDIFLILISPVILTIVLVWLPIEAILNRTVWRKKVKLAQYKDYQEVSNGTQKRLTNCQQRYNEYFNRI
jgi:ABC-type siderophore export system fused ATPase/permease subunit